MPCADAGAAGGKIQLAGIILERDSISRIEIGHALSRILSLRRCVGSWESRPRIFWGLRTEKHNRKMPKYIVFSISPYILQKQNEF